MPHFISQLIHIFHAILPFIIAISILVFIHEYGHFWVARKNGVKVDVFSIGFGKELFGWTDKHGTRWRISPFPFGGYVKFAGDADVSSTTTDASAVSAMSETERQTTLFAKTPLQRIAVSVAGPAANYLFAIIAMMLVLVIKGVPQYELVVHDTLDGHNGAKAGIMKNDVIIAINDKRIEKQQDVLHELSNHAGQDVTITVKRKTDEGFTNVDIQSPLYTEQNGLKSNAKLGISMVEHVKNYEHVSVIKATTHAIHYCWTLSIEMLKGIGRMITGNGGELGGIGTIGSMAKQSLESGWVEFTMFLIVLSVNLGLVNLLPIPVLDGGTILLTTIEAIRKKPLSQKLQEHIFKVGFLIVASLMLYTTLSDVLRFKLFAKVASLFG